MRPWRYRFSIDRREARAALGAAQAGICGACFDPAPACLQLDHDHSTDLVRGLLCPGCNVSDGRSLCATRPWDLYLAEPPAMQPDILASMASHCATAIARLDEAPAVAWRADLWPPSLREAAGDIEPHVWLDGVNEEWDEDSRVAPEFPCAFTGCGIGYHWHPLRRFSFDAQVAQRAVLDARLWHMKKTVAAQAEAQHVDY